MNLRGGRGRRCLVAVTLTVAPLAASCSGDNETPAYSPQVAQQLRADAADVRAAAERHKPRAAQAALHRLTRHVAVAQADGQLPTDKAREILRAADLVAEDLAAIPSPTPRSTPERDKDDDEHHGPEEGPREDGEKPEGWEAHKGDGEKPEGWEAHKKED